MQLKLSPPGGRVFTNGCFWMCVSILKLFNVFLVRSPFLQQALLFQAIKENKANKGECVLNGYTVLVHQPDPSSTPVENS